MPTPYAGPLHSPRWRRGSRMASNGRVRRNSATRSPRPPPRPSTKSSERTKALARSNWGKLSTSKHASSYSWGRPTKRCRLLNGRKKPFGALYPSDPARIGLATARQQSGRLLFALQRPEDGRARTEKAIALFRKLVAERPDDVDTRFLLARTENNLGNFLMAMDPERAPAQYAIALEQFAQLRRATNDSPLYVEWDARTRSNLGLVLAGLGRIDESVATQTEAAQMARHVVETLPDEIQLLDLLSTCETNLGQALQKAGRLDDAKRVFLAALPPYQQLAVQFPEETEFHWEVAMVQTYLASVLILE